ncbi:lysophospholipase II [Nemania serpens]|nr:lysophospholipase II [Nemania serpens]
MSSDDAHVVDPTEAHTHTIVFFHDRGSNGSEFAEKFLGCVGSEPTDKPQALRDLFPGVRWVFPNAPVLPSKRLGAEISQWFDIWSMEEPTERAELQGVGLQAAVRRMHGVFAEEEGMVPRERIFVGGIGQGFATAITVFYAAPGGRFAGLIGLGGWVPVVLCSDTYRRVAGANWLTEDESPHSRRRDARAGSGGGGGGTPLFLGHAADDDVVPIAYGRELRNIARAQRLRVEWREYEDGGHEVKEPQGVDDLAHFINARMAGA